MRSEGLGRLGGLAATEGRAGHHLGHTGQSGVASRVGVVGRGGPVPSEKQRKNQLASVNTMLRSTKQVDVPSTRSGLYDVALSGT